MGEERVDGLFITSNSLGLFTVQRRVLWDLEDERFVSGTSPSRSEADRFLLIPRRLSAGYSHFNWRRWHWLIDFEPVNTNTSLGQG
jgi:hypothetical protein